MHRNVVLMQFDVETVASGEANGRFGASWHLRKADEKIKINLIFDFFLHFNLEITLKLKM